MKNGNKTTLEELMLKAYKAQKTWEKKFPEEYARQKAERAIIDKNEAERNLLIPYRLRDIPDAIAKTIVCGVTTSGKKLSACSGERRLFEAFKDGRILVILLGVVGTGKTIAGCRWLMSQHEGIYIKSREFCAYSEKMSIDRPFIKLLYETPSLFVEEVGTEEQRDIGKIRELLQVRFDNNLKTICAMNFTPEKSEELLGKRVSRRLFALGKQVNFREILCEGEKRRKALRK